MSPEVSWRNGLLALKPSFELGALRFPDLRMYMFRGNARQDYEVRLDLIKQAKELEFPGIDFSRLKTISWNIDDGESHEEVINGELVRDPVCNHITLCGDYAGACRFLEMADGAGNCIAQHLPWSSDYCGTLVHFLPDHVWIDTIFRVAWELRSDIPLRAQKSVGGKLPEGCFCSFLRLNPFRASVVLVDVVLNDLSLGLGVDLHGQSDRVMSNCVNLERLDGRLSEILGALSEEKPYGTIAAAVRQLVQDYTGDTHGPCSLFQPDWEEMWGQRHRFPDGTEPLETKWIGIVDGLDERQRAALAAVCVEAVRFLKDSDTQHRKQKHARQLSEALKDYTDRCTANEAPRAGTGPKKGKPGRRSNRARDKKLWSEYRHLLETRQITSQRDFARKKNLEPSTMNKALKRGEEACNEDGETLK